MTKDELSGMTRMELIALARRKKISVLTKMSKAELISTLQRELKKQQPKTKTQAVASPSHTAKKGIHKKASKKKKAATKKTTSTRKPASKKSATQSQTVKASKHRKTVNKGTTKTKAALASNHPKSKLKKKDTTRSPAEKKTPIPLASPPKVEEDLAAKFILGDSGIHDEAFQEKPQELPQGYGDHILVALPRDPSSVYLFWEIDYSRLKREMRDLGISRENAGWEFRAHLLDPNDPTHSLKNFGTDLDVNQGAGYLNLSPPGNTFKVELKLIGPDGSFRSVLETDPFTLPADRPSSRMDENWIPSKHEAQYHYSGTGYLGPRPQAGSSGAKPAQKTEVMEAKPPSSHNRPRR